MANWQIVQLSCCGAPYSTPLCTGFPLRYISLKEEGRLLARWMAGIRSPNSWWIGQFKLTETLMFCGDPNRTLLARGISV